MNTVLVCIFYRFHRHLGYFFNDWCKQHSMKIIRSIRLKKYQAIGGFNTGFQPNKSLYMFVNAGTEQIRQKHKPAVKIKKKPK